MMILKIKLILSLNHYSGQILATHTFSSKQNFIEYYNSHILSIFNLIEFSKKNLVKKIVKSVLMQMYMEKLLLVLLQKKNNQIILIW